MDAYTLQVFQKSDTEADLRFLGPDGRLLGSRELSSEDINRFVQEVEAQYRQYSPQHALLGQRLYEWLDGPTERWLEKALQGSTGLTLRIDVSQRLRHLPWELLCREGAFLATNPHRPFSPVRYVAGPPLQVPCDNRPLHVLFMASSPEDVTPVLDFEAEERMILEATRKHPIELLVEESGSLTGLEEWLTAHGPGYADIVHLTGHAGFKNGDPCFFMEDEFGLKTVATAESLARAFGGHFPKLVFLAGCSTAQAVAEGSLPSLCEALVEAGAPAVLGWALPVGDRSAGLAAARLYGELAIGHEVSEAVARTRQALQERKRPYWHLLRLYVGKAPLPAYVTPLYQPGRARLHRRPARAEFLDARSKVEVCAREDFVGRRRPLQRCLRVLRSVEGEDSYAEGVLLIGMGGLGKSSLATRLCERMPHHKRLVWVGRVDELELQRVVGERLGQVEVNALLNETKLGLKQRFQRLFEGPWSGQPLLFVFDDFEHNLQSLSDGTHALRPEALAVLGALLAAIRETASESRVIVTSRHAFPIPGPASLYIESLEALRGADLEKKAERLPTLSPESGTDEVLKKRALELSSGNPRLMERLDRVLAEEGLDHQALLDALAAKTEELREELLLRELLGRLGAEGQRLLALLAVYELPVEAEAVVAVASGVPVEPHLRRAVALGLVEKGRTVEGAPRYAVSGLVRALLSETLSVEEAREAQGRAAEYLYEAHWKQKKGIELKWDLETHRLALVAGKQAIAAEVGAAIATVWVNQSRYREAVALSEATLRLGEDYRLLHQRARAEEVLGETTAAREHFEKALAGCPVSEAKHEVRERAAIVHNLAELTALRGETSQAMELWQQSLELEESIGNVRGKAATLHEMAGIIARKGDIPRALELWQQSLEFHESTGNVLGKAATLHQMAGVIAQQGDAPRALKLWQQSLELHESTGDVRGKAATLHQMAGVIAKQGDVLRALELWRQSLELEERIGNVQGKAATLANMAWATNLSGNHTQARAFNLEAARALASIRSWPDLVTVLNNLSVFEDQGAVAFLAQALWLSIYVDGVPAASAISLTSTLIDKLTPAADLSPLLAAVALRLIHTRSQHHPQRDDLLIRAASLLAICAQARAVALDQFAEWISHEGLDDPTRTLEALLQGLERLVPEQDWLFDRRLLSSES